MIMTNAEAEKFYEKDKKEYMLNKNKQFLKWYREMTNSGYCVFIDLEELQETIDRIADWYEYKYPNREFEFYEGVRDPKFQDITSISEHMTVFQLLFRLPHNSLCLLEGKYRFCHVSIPYIEDKKPKCRYDGGTSISIDSITGMIRCGSLNYIGITTDSDLRVDIAVDYLKRYHKECYVDYKPLENTVFQHNIDIELRKKILELASLKLMYSRNSKPEWGYERAKRYINEFKQEIPSLNSTMDEIRIKMDGEHDGVKREHQKVAKI